MFILDCSFHYRFKSQMLTLGQLCFFFVVTVQCFNVYYYDMRFLYFVCGLNAGHLQGPKCAVNSPEMWQTQYDSEQILLG